ncbi:MAG: hypothetical protein ACTSU2_12265 [Promethearchaeota archaeon]
MTELESIIKDLIKEKELNLKKLKKNELKQLISYLDQEYIDIEELHSKNPAYYNILILLNNIFITWNNNSEIGLKWRFLHFRPFFPDWNNMELMKTDIKINNLNIDLIFKENASNQKTDNNSKIIKEINDFNLVWGFFIRKLDNYKLDELKNQIETNLNDKTRDHALNPDYIKWIPKKICIFISELDDVFSLNLNLNIHVSKEQVYTIPIEIWQEYIDHNRGFGKDDLIILGNLRIGGFNFSSIEEILEIAKDLNPGALTIYKVDKFFKNVLNGLKSELSSSKISNYIEKSRTLDVLPDNLDKLNKIPIWNGIIKPKLLFQS